MSPSDKNSDRLIPYQPVYPETVPNNLCPTASECNTMLPGDWRAERPVVERGGNLIMVDDDRFKLEPGEEPQMRRVRFRTLGCYPLTGAVESEATTLPEVIQEMLLAKQSERQGRVIDYDEAASMERKKREGYF